MDQKMTWEEVKRTYPDEWVAFVDYHVRDAVEVDGIVVAHHPERKPFHLLVKGLFPQYGNMSIRYTGELIKNPEIPLLWQISHTVSTGG